MSLTRQQWIEMWESVKKIEKLSYWFRNKEGDRIREEVKKMKEQIQSVIGQME